MQYNASMPMMSERDCLRVLETRNIGYPPAMIIIYCKKYKA